MTRAILLSVAICCFALALAADPGLCHAGDADDSERIMEEAAASLKFFMPENRAYMLEKHSEPFVPFWSKMAVVFGYIDNRAACEEIADAMTKIKNADRDPGETPYKFECNPIDRK